MKEKLQFDWDQANRDHIGQHSVTPEEVEHLVLHQPLVIEEQTRSGEARTIYLGETAVGRVLFVATTLREQKVRVVTAWPAKRKWIGFWRDHGR
jgi:uncharacterized DUF497 family protein